MAEGEHFTNALSTTTDELKRLIRREVQAMEKRRKARAEARQSVLPSDNASSQSTGGSGVNLDSFLALADTPADYSGHALELLRVNNAEDAVEFHELQLGDLGDVSVPSPSSGEVLQWNGSQWIADTVSASPAGSDHEIQFNDSGSFGADSAFTWDNDNDVLGINGHIDFTGIADPSYAAGQLWYSTDTETLSFHNDRQDVTLNIGEEQYVRVRNKTGSQIDNGEAVYISGFDSGSGRPLVQLAKADSLSTAKVTGIATEDIPANANGMINTFGLVRGLDTSAWSAGDILWLSASTAGALTNTQPTNPNESVEIGQVAKSDANNGQIIITAPENRAANLGELNDVNADSANTDAILNFDGTNWFDTSNVLLDDSQSTLNLNNGGQIQLDSGNLRLSVAALNVVSDFTISNSGAGNSLTVQSGDDALSLLSQDLLTISSSANDISLDANGDIILEPGGTTNQVRVDLHPDELINFRRWNGSSYISRFELTDIGTWAWKDSGGSIDIRLQRTGTNQLRLDDGSGGNIDLNIVGHINGYAGTLGDGDVLEWNATNGRFEVASNPNTYNEDLINGLTSGQEGSSLSSGINIQTNGWTNNGSAGSPPTVSARYYGWRFSDTGGAGGTGAVYTEAQDVSHFTNATLYIRVRYFGNAPLDFRLWGGDVSSNSNQSASKSISTSFQTFSWNIDTSGLTSADPIMFGFNATINRNATTTIEVEGFWVEDAHN